MPKHKPKKQPHQQVHQQPHRRRQDGGRDTKRDRGRVTGEHRDRDRNRDRERPHMHRHRSSDRERERKRDEDRHRYREETREKGKGRGEGEKKGRGKKLWSRVKSGGKKLGKWAWGKAKDYGRKKHPTASHIVDEGSKRIRDYRRRGSHDEHGHGGGRRDEGRRSERTHRANIFDADNLDYYYYDDAYDGNMNVYGYADYGDIATANMFDADDLDYYYNADLGDYYDADGDMNAYETASFSVYDEDDGLDSFYYTLDGEYSNQYGRRQLMEFGENDSFLYHIPIWMLTVALCVELMIVCCLITAIRYVYKKINCGHSKMAEITYAALKSDEDDGALSKEAHLIKINDS